MKTSVENAPHYLYRHFDKDGELLYVGITHRLGTRIYQHERDSDWWSQVVSIKIENFSSRNDALKAENVANISENPRHNSIPITPRVKDGVRMLIGMEPPVLDWLRERAKHGRKTPGAIVAEIFRQQYAALPFDWKERLKK